jgi:hypothetical protein
VHINVSGVHDGIRLQGCNGLHRGFENHEIGVVVSEEELEMEFQRLVTCGGTRFFANSQAMTVGDVCKRLLIENKERKKERVHNFKLILMHIFSYEEPSSKLVLYSSSTMHSHFRIPMQYKHSLYSRSLSSIISV